MDESFNDLLHGAVRRHACSAASSAV